MDTLKIGTLINGCDAERLIPQLAPLGFESFSLTFWETTGDADIPELGKRINELAQKHNVKISTVSIYGNPLGTREKDEITREGWYKLINNAHIFGADMVTGFAGRVIDETIDKSMPRFKEIFEPMVKLAEEKNLKIAFENCPMGGDWNRGDYNIAHNPIAWELMFETIPSDVIGLEWEPCHQMVCLIDPIPQLRKWVNKIFHVHGKDATIAWDIIKEYGIHGARQFAWHRTPGFGDSNWADIITILRQNNYKGTIDIEGYHDPVYREELELMGQVAGLEYLKRCRGGDFIKSVF